MKFRFTVLICILTICLFNVMTPVSASGSVGTDVVEVHQEEEAATPKGIKIAGFLVIFTVAMGATAFIVARPSLKKLKESKKNKSE